MQDTMLYRTALLLWAFAWIAGSAIADEGLVLHYTFDEIANDTVKDHSSYGNHGQVTDAQHLDEFDGRKGVMRFNGETALVNCGQDESLNFGGDMTFAMWARLNREVAADWGYIFGESPIRSFHFTFAHHHTLMLWYHTGDGSVALPVDRNILNDRWSHIAVVVEYPRCRFYHNGKLIRDAFMPAPGLVKRGSFDKHIGANEPGAACPLDLDEFRFYRRALSSEEIAAQARDQSLPFEPNAEVAVEPNWYDDSVSVRVSAKGDLFRHGKAKIRFINGNGEPISETLTTDLAESHPGSSRYVGMATFAIEALRDRSIDCVVDVVDRDDNTLRSLFRHTHLSKPDWIKTTEGWTDDVPAPWTAVEARTADGSVRVNVWGRQYHFGHALLPRQVATRDKELLAAPATLVGRADHADIHWQDTEVTLTRSSPTTAVMEQTRTSKGLTLRAVATVEFDGFVTYEYELTALRDVKLDNLTLDIPLKSRHATLAYGIRVLPENLKPLISQWYSGALKSDQSFRFSSTIWLGDEQRGLTWQAESDQYWRPADPQRAIRILLHDDVTIFRANLIDRPTAMKQGDRFFYKFALQATPVKPMLRDVWDLRIARSDPYGNDLDLPDRRMNGKPMLAHYAELGIRHLFINANDVFAWPMPFNRHIADLIARLSDATHEHGLRLYQYLIHERVPVMVPPFDLYGADMANHPVKQYVPGGYPLSWTGQSGPVANRWGANSQGTILFCVKSDPLQDAFLHSLGQRLDTFGEDGVYLDGTGEPVACSNFAHGCGYVDADGQTHQTYPVFAGRQFLKRLYTVVKSRRSEAVIDLHNSGINISSLLAYADVFWNGEQWWHQRDMEDLETRRVSHQLVLDKFRTEFTGYQMGTPGETLSYRLGSRMKVSATSLLHDVPVRVRTQETDFLHLMSKLWKVRDQFGAKEARKLFYWMNQKWVTVSPANCYATLLHHPTNGVLAFVTNLDPEAQRVMAQFNLDELALDRRELEVFNALSDEHMAIDENGAVTLPLDSEQWVYLWLRAGK